MIGCFLGDAFGGLSCPFWSTVADTRRKLPDRVIIGASFLTGVCLSVTFHIVGLWQYCECCTRTCVTRCTIFMCSTWALCAIAVTVGALVAHRYTYEPLAAEPRSTRGLLFSCQYLCGRYIR